jgi:hypothetical protein
MSTRPNFAPRASQGLDIGDLLRLAAAMKGAAPQAPTAEAGGANEPSKLIRELVRASFASDERGEKLRAGWKLVGAGAIEILRAFSADEPAVNGG